MVYPSWVVLSSEDFISVSTPPLDSDLSLGQNIQQIYTLRFSSSLATHRTAPAMSIDTMCKGLGLNDAENPLNSLHRLPVELISRVVDFIDWSEREDILDFHFSCKYVYSSTIP